MNEELSMSFDVSSITNSVYTDILNSGPPSSYSSGSPVTLASATPLQKLLQQQQQPYKQQQQQQRHHPQQQHPFTKKKNGKQLQTPHTQQQQRQQKPPKQPKQPRTVTTLVFSNPKSTMAPILTWFGNSKNSNNNNNNSNNINADYNNDPRHIHAAVQIQQWIRANRRSRVETAAAILIQSTWRGSVEREAYNFYKLMLSSVELIQSVWRGWLGRQRYHTILEATWALQHLADEEYNRRPEIAQAFSQILSSSSSVSASASSSCANSNNHNIILPLVQGTPLRVRSTSSRIGSRHTTNNSNNNNNYYYSNDNGKSPTSVVPQNSLQQRTSFLTNPKSQKATVLSWFGNVRTSNHLDDADDDDIVVVED